MAPPRRPNAPLSQLRARSARRRTLASALAVLTLAAAPFVGCLQLGGDDDDDDESGSNERAGAGGSQPSPSSSSSLPGTPTTPAPGPSPTTPPGPTTPPTSPTPTTPPTTPMPPPTPGVPDGPVGEVFKLVNEARGEARTCGSKSFEAVPPLRWNDRLAAAAQVHSADMVELNYFDHVSPSGSRPEDRVSAQGYVFSSLGENIAAGQPTPAAAMATWLESPDHCSSIMSPTFVDFGAGLAQGGSFNFYWTQVFAKP